VYIIYVYNIIMLDDFFSHICFARVDGGIYFVPYLPTEMSHNNYTQLHILYRFIYRECFYFFKCAISTVIIVCRLTYINIHK